MWPPSSLICTVFSSDFLCVLSGLRVNLLYSTQTMLSTHRGAKKHARTNRTCLVMDRMMNLNELIPSRRRRQFLQTSLPADLAAAGDALGLGKSSEKILAQHLADLLLGVTTAEHFIGDKGKVLDAFHPFGQKVYAVEIGAEADMIYPRNLFDMVDVIDDLRIGRDIDRVRGQQLSLGIIETGWIVGELPSEFFDLRPQPFRTLVLLPVRALIQKGRVKDDHYHTTVLRQSLQNAVGNIAGMAVYSSGAGVRCHQRGLGNIQHVEHYFFGNMRNVDHHPQPVHLADNLFSKFRQAVILDLAAVGVAPVVRNVMGQRHITDAQAIEVSQCIKRVLDRVAALYTHQEADLILLLRSPDLVRGCAH